MTSINEDNAYRRGKKDGREEIIKRVEVHLAKGESLIGRLNKAIEEFNKPMFKKDGKLDI